MKTRYSKIVARELKEAVIEIYGGIGDTVNGDYLAKEINYLDKNTDQLRFRINSMGGNFVQGLSIISAITGAKAKTVGVIEGIAGSMSGYIALSCQHVIMNDFARLMLHAPYYKDENGRVDNLTEDEKKALESLTGIVVDLLTRRGKTKEEIEKLLEKDTWYTAEEALAEGFIDEIINTGVATAAAGLSIEKLVAFAAEALSNGGNSPLNPPEGGLNPDKTLITNMKIMKNIAAKLGLPETSDEVAIVAAIDQKDAAVAAARTKFVDSAITAGKIAGTVTDKNEAQMRKLAVADLDLFIDLVVRPSAAADNTRLSEVIAAINLSKEEKKDEKNWDWYQKNDSEALAEMKVKEPEKFNKLYEEYWGK